MHAMKLASAGGAPPLFGVREPAKASVREETIEISHKTDIGRAICFWQAFVNADERLRLRFLDGGTWIGNVTLSREDDDLAFKVEGTIFGGSGDDRGVSLSFVCEPDGPIGLPIIVRDCDGFVIGFYTDADDDNPEPDLETVKAAFWASGASFTGATAPPIKPESHLGYAAESAKMGAALHKAATTAEKNWLTNLGREKGIKGGNNGEKWFHYQGRTLVQMAPGEKIESARMPRPEKAPPAPGKRAIHKRAGKGTLTKAV